jgi:PAS domain S-box-containing protein
MGRMDRTAIVLLDRDGVIRFWSEGAQTLFGHRGADVTGSSVEVIIPGHLRDRHRTGWHKAWERGQIGDNLVALIPVLCADGSVTGFAGRLQPVYSAHGELVAAIGIWSPASADDAGLYHLG